MEQDRFFKRSINKKVSESPSAGADDLIATIKGELSAGKLNIKSVDLDELKSEKEKLDYPPAIAIVFEGSDKKYKLVLNKGQEDEDENNDWDLKLKITGKTKKGAKKLSFESKHPTMIKGAPSVYLENRAENRGKKEDKKADIQHKSPTHPGYIRMLKRHLANLGFYMYELDKKFKYELITEKEKEKPYKYLKYNKRQNRGIDVTYFSDKWDDEVWVNNEGEAISLLHQAIADFQYAARKSNYRLDGNSGEFVEGEDFKLEEEELEIFDQERKEVRVGDITKKLLIKWLGSDYQTVDGCEVLPRYRNPLIYSKGYIQRYLGVSAYSESKVGYDKICGRLINYRFHSDEDGKENYDYPCFVCTTSVNWVFSHILARGKKYKHGTSDSVVDAVLGLKGKNVPISTPRYYNEYFKEGTIKPAFTLPWLHPKDPELVEKTVDILRMHEKVYPFSVVPISVFSVKQEVALMDEDGTSISIRYMPKSLYGKYKKFLTVKKVEKYSIEYQLLDSKDVFAPKAWKPEGGATFSYVPGKFLRVRIKFNNEDDIKAIQGKTVLVSYEAKDRFCVIKKDKWPDDEVNHCRCGLHKCKEEIYDNVDKLKNWNMVTTSAFCNHEISTLSLYKDKSDPPQLSFYHSNQYGDFSGESAIHFLVFSVMDISDLEKINPVSELEPKWATSNK